MATILPDQMPNGKPQRTGLRSGSGTSAGSAAPAVAVLSVFGAVNALSCSGVSVGRGGPASLAAIAASAAGVGSESAVGGVKPPAVSTVPHSLGSCAMVSGGLPVHGLVPGGTGFADSIAAFFSMAYQLASSCPQPSSPDTSFWSSQPSIPGGHLSRTWK